MSALLSGVTLTGASAGTGKTFEIAQLVVELVLEGVPLPGMLVVTFTEAATSELRDRIRKRLRDAWEGLTEPDWEAPDEPLRLLVENTPKSAAPLLRDALVSFDLCVISTIHGFCAKALRRHCLRTGSSLDAEMVSGPGPLLDQLVDDFYIQLSHDKPRSIVPALQLGQLDQAMLRHLARQANSLGVVPVLPDIPHTDFPDIQPWYDAVDVLRKAVESDGATLHKTLSGAAFWKQKGANRTAYSKGVIADGMAAVSKVLGDEVNLLSDLPAGIQALRPAWFQQALKPGRSVAMPATLQAVEDLCQAHSALSDALERWLISARRQLVAQVHEVLPEWLRHTNQRTFRELLTDLRDAIRSDADLRDALAEDFEVVLVDEFQDTDPIQWEIFDTVFRDRLALVGDPKQAMYAFRGADIHTYFRAEQDADRKKPLDRNFRTDGVLHRAIGHLFERCTLPFATPDLVPFRHPEAACPDSRLPGDSRPPLTFRFMPRKGANNKNGVIPGWWLRQRMPAIVADDIAQELARQGQIRRGDGTLETVTARDCAVLTRTNNEARDIQSALRARGIPSVHQGTASVFDSPVVHALERVLSGILAPSDADAIRRALTSPLMGRTADDIGHIDDKTWSGQVGAFREWNRIWLDEGFVAMFQAWMGDDGVAERVLAQADGERMLTDLLHLGELLHDAALTKRLGPSGLVRWLQRASDDTGARLESDADAVQIYTMHKAKGLEFGLVWCPYLWSSGFVSDKDKVHLRFFDHHDDTWKLDVGSDDRAAHLALREQETLEEDLRIAYVALTRPMHRLTVYWGAVDATRSALGYLLHQDRDEDTVSGLLTSARRRVHRDEHMLEDLEARQREIPGIAIAPVDWEAMSNATMPTPVAPDEPVAELERKLVDTWWRRSSFSGLCRRTQQTPGAEDEPADDKNDVSMPSHPSAVPAGMGEAVLDLPGGPGPGTMIHTILEHHDFQDPDALEPACRQHLRDNGFDADVWGPKLAQTLEDMLHTPLGTGFCMADIPRSKRLDELEFTLPVHGGYTPSGQLTNVSLSKAFAPEHPDVAAQVRKLRFQHLRGFLNGKIDLLFEHGGAWYVLDWKSNVLGPTHLHYHRSLLWPKMVATNYALQYHLYTVAADRYLRARLGDYTFGGVLYLYLRGMKPRWGADHGVFFDKPDPPLIQRLAATLEGR